MQYRLCYRCPLCNENIYSEISLELTEDQTTDLISRILKNQTMINNPYLYQMPMHVIHNCKDGSKGIAFVSGLERESKYDKL